MYSSNIKTIRACNGMLFVFYYSQGSIFFVKIHKGSSSAPIKIADNTYPMFSVWCTDNGIYIMFNGDQGTVLCFYNYSRWVSRIIAKDLGESCSRISFFTDGESVHLLYSIKNINSNTESLFIRSMKKDKWEQPKKVSDIMPFPNTPYFIGRENNDKIKIYYRISDKTIKYRSLNLCDGNMTEAENLLATSMPCYDISILTKNDESHILYLAQGMFSSQLIYKGIKSGRQIKARVIWEGQLSGSCLLFCHNGRLYALMYNENNVYAVHSDSENIYFSTVKNLNIRLNSSCVKSEYIDFSSDNMFSSDELIVNTNDNSFPVTDDIYPQFIPENQTVQSIPQQKASPINSLQAAEYEKQISSMNDRLGELSSTLAKRNEEIATLSARWRMKYEALSKENETLKNRISKITSETTALTSQNDYENNQDQS